MRIPHTVSNIIIALYEESDDEDRSYSEEKEAMVSHNFKWDEDSVPKLSILTIIRLSRMFDVVQPLTGILQQDIEYLMEIIPTCLDLHLTVKLISYEIYWKRCCEEKWPDMVIVPYKSEDFWKRTYLAGYLRDYLETSEPDSFDVGAAADLAILVSRYVDYLNIRSLKTASLPLSLERSDDPPVDHIPLKGVLSRLTNLTKVRIVFGAVNLGDSFDWRLLNVSRADCISICGGLSTLTSIKTICINKSRVEDEHVKIFLGFIANKHTVEEVDFSHCYVADEGLKAIANVMMTHENLKVIRIANNRFEEKGMKELAFCLQSEPLAILQILDLRMNMLSEKSANYLASALVHCTTKPIELLISCCGLTGDSATSIAEMLMLNSSISRLDISANDFSAKADCALLNSVRNNTRITYMERRFTGILNETDTEIKEILKKNILRSKLKEA